MFVIAYSSFDLYSIVLIVIMQGECAWLGLSGLGLRVQGLDLNIKIFSILD